jgi:hypothetical protein
VTLAERIKSAEAGSWGESPNADLPQPKMVVRLRVFGRAGDRDPDAVCDDFTPGVPNGRCSTDGHYMCLECEHAELCEGCKKIEARCECHELQREQQEES